MAENEGREGCESNIHHNDVIDLTISDDDDDDNGWLKPHLNITSDVGPLSFSPRLQSTSSSQRTAGPPSTRSDDSNPIVALIRLENMKQENPPTNKTESSICDDVVIPIGLGRGKGTGDEMDCSSQLLKSSTQGSFSSEMLVPLVKKLTNINITTDKDSASRQSNSTTKIGTRKRSSHLSAKSSSRSPKIGKLGTKQDILASKISIATEEPSTSTSRSKISGSMGNDPSQSNKSVKRTPSEVLFPKRPKSQHALHPCQVEVVPPKVVESTSGTNNQNLEPPGAQEVEHIVCVLVKEDGNTYSRLPGNSPYSEGGWHPINFKENETRDQSQKQFYKIAQMNVELNSSAFSKNPGAHNLSGHLTQRSLIDAFPGLVQFQIQVEQKRVKRSNIIRLVTETEFSDEEADHRKIRDMVVQPNEFPGKKLKFLLVEYFSYEFETLKVPPELIALSGEGRTIFELEFQKFIVTDKNEAKMFVININFSSTAIVGDPSYDERIVKLHQTKTVQSILNHLFKGSNEPSGLSSMPRPALLKSDAVRFFSLIKDFQLYEHDRSKSIQHVNLISKLFTYQQKSVKWMLQRENNSNSLDDLKVAIYRRMYIEIQLNEGSESERTAYYCTTSGQISWEKQPFNEFQIPKLPSGGILADEMGLGKTIEMLSLILANGRPLVDHDGEINSGPESEMSNIAQIEPSTSKQKPPKNPCCKQVITAGDTNDKDGMIVTCIECTAVHHAKCFGYDQEFFSDQGLKKYMCPWCVSKKEPVPAKSTLIVVPRSILHQWINEIDNNVADLDYVVYSGVSQSPYQPADVLSQYDIVLTTYETLRAETTYTNLTTQPQHNESERLRNPRLYVPLPSPLTSLGWWRMVLDEAQMVENVNTSMSTLARQISAQHRWCMTGTPIMKTMQNLYGLCTFLGVEVISSEISWETLVMEPWRNTNTSIIGHLFSPFFFRTEKKDKGVEDELRLPSQTEVIHMLELSPPEKVLHSAKYSLWSQVLRKQLESYTPEKVDLCALNKLTCTTVEKLRRIAGPPQIGNGKVETFKLDERDDKGKPFFGTLTVPRLLQGLIKESRGVCAKTYKLLVISLNEIAGLSKLLGEKAEALSKYKEILSLVRKHNVDWNNTQRIEEIHSMANLLDLIEKDDGEKETRKEAQYFLNKTKETLLDKYAKSLSTVNKDLTSLNKNIQDGTKIIKTMPSNQCWWLSVMEAFEDKSFEKFIDEMKDSILIDAKEFKWEDVCRYNDNKTLNIQMTKKKLSEKLEENVFKKMKESYTKLLTLWTRLNAEDPNKTHRFVSTCKSHNERTTTTNPPVVAPGPSSRTKGCELCAFRRHLRDFESLVISAPQIKVGRKDQHSEADKLKASVTHGFEDESITEHILNEIFYVAKRLNILNIKQEFEQGVAHKKLFKDFKNLCLFMADWLSMKEAQMSHFDLIYQATVPLASAKKLNYFQTKLLDPEHLQDFIEGRAQTLTRTCIEGRIKDQISKLSTIVQIDFDKSVTHLEYLKMLERNECGRFGYVNLDLCSCSKVLGQKWGFLPCGHSICEMCGDILGSVCEILGCEQQSQHSDVLYVDTKSARHVATKNELTWPISPTTIKGEPFAKVEAIIRTLKSLKENPTIKQKSNKIEKVLIVTNSETTLKELGIALRENDIPFDDYSSNRSSCRRCLIEFRTNDKQVLLMPLSIASAAGINLTEANHIFLGEPILNSSLEQQAIGRIHRLGQEKETFIHRFYVAGTVEEKFYQRSKNPDAVGFEEGNMSVGDLQELLEVQC